MTAFTSWLIILGIIFLILAVILSWAINDTVNWEYYYFLRKVQKVFLNISALCFVAWSLIKTVQLYW